MITTANLRPMLQAIGFTETEHNIFTKQYQYFNFAELRVDFNIQKIIYPEAQGLKVWDTTSSGNFEHPENFVVLDCITRLLDKGYRPEHIELEKEWKMGHTAKSGKADIVVYDENKENVLLIIECKTAGTEYKKELTNLKADGGQLFSYWQQEGSTKWLALYCSDFKDGIVKYENAIVNCTDDANILKMAQKDKTILTYRNALTVQELHEAWTETYLQTTYDDLIFSDKTQAYQIGLRPLTKGDLQDFKPDDKIVNKFEEILRHNNVSDKENAFNRLIALFICKLVDEIKKNDQDEVEFQYKVGTDTYESLQDRLQRLHKIGMKEFMQEEINYVDDNYAEQLFTTYNASKRKKAIEDLRNTIRILKYYTNNDFTFKDVHNEELFYQNGKVLVEVVQLFEKYRIVYATKHQFLGDLFENLLAKGFKQNEGQFFTPMPITRFIWDCLPLDKVLHTEEGYRVPKVIDYACGAGHFLTEAVEAINVYMHNKDKAEQVAENIWVEKHIFGVEKDYRLARVAKVSLYMNGAGKGQILFGDGLEQYPEKDITNGTFDILVANPPYSVDSFKAHLKLKNNSFEILDLISNSGNEIETLFVERIAQLLRPQGVAAVVLPSSILSNDSGSYVAAREQILKHFNLRAIVQLGGKTFGATSTNTVILFLEKYNEPPKRKEQVVDSVEAIMANEVSTDWEDRAILDEYLQKIGVLETDYTSFVKKTLSLSELQQIPYFAEYVTKFNASTELAQMKNKKTFKELSAAEQMAKVHDLFYKQQLEAEKEKIYYFALIYKQNTIIITAPKDNNEQKRFLGYDWSNRRGSEGIQIQTPGGMLYDNDNRAADYTLAAAVRYAYNGVQAKIPEREQYYVFARLQDMIEFARPVFNKAIKTTPEKRFLVQSKYPLVPFSEIVSIVETGSRPTGGVGLLSEGALSLGGEHIDNNNGSLNLSTPKYVPIDYYRNAVRGKIKKDDILLCKDGALTGKVAIVRDEFNGKNAMINEHVFIIRCDDLITQKYLFQFLYSSTGQNLLHANVTGSAQGGLNSSNLKAIKIPLPPMDIQQQIVTECAQVDEEYNNSRMSVEDYRKKIAQVFENLQVIGDKQLTIKRLGDVCESYIGLTYKPENVADNGILVLRSSNIKDGQLDINDQVRVKAEIPEKLYVKNGDVLVCVRNGSKRLLGKAAYIGNISEPMTFGAFMAICRSDMGKWIYIWMQSKHYTDQLEAITATVSINQLTQHTLLDLHIPIPSLSNQQRIIAEVEHYEAEIRKAQAIMDGCAARKKAILDKYLN